MADEQQTAEARMQMAQAAHMKALQENVAAVVSLGREELGEQTFDSLASDLADVIGKDAIMPVMSSIIETDVPVRIIRHLSENPAEAKELAGMTPARRSAALGRIESRILPHGANVGMEPAWRTQARAGNRPRLTDDASDSSFEQAWRKKYPNGFVPPSLGGPRDPR